jgi:hypothetical protein
MSIDTKQIIHIASEVVIIGGITAFFINKTNSLSDQIEELCSTLQKQNDIIQQQSEIIQKHDNLILRLLNTVNILVQENENKSEQCPIEPKNISIKTESKPSKKLSQNNLKLPLPQTINSTKQVLIMIPPQIKTENKIDNRVEEVIDDENSSNIVDNSSTILDEELEEELRELDNELEDEKVEEYDDEV